MRYIILYDIISHFGSCGVILGNLWYHWQLVFHLPVLKWVSWGFHSSTTDLLWTSWALAVTVYTVSTSFPIVSELVLMARVPMWRARPWCVPLNTWSLRILSRKAMCRAQITTRQTCQNKLKTHQTLVNATNLEALSQVFKDGLGYSSSIGRSMICWNSWSARTRPCWQWQDQSLVEGSVGICCWRQSSGLYTPMPCHKFFRKIHCMNFPPLFICFDKVVLFMKGNPDMPQCGFSRAVAQAGLLGAHEPKFCGTTLVRHWKRSASPTMRMLMCLVPSVNDRLLPMYAPAFSMIIAMLIRLTLPMNSESLGRIDWRCVEVEISRSPWRCEEILGLANHSSVVRVLSSDPVWSFTALLAM